MIPFPSLSCQSPSSFGPDSTTAFQGQSSKHNMANCVKRQV
ncbi:unnamed protein product, partial [Mycena citricolor]